VTAAKFPADTASNGCFPLHPLRPRTSDLALPHSLFVCKLNVTVHCRWSGGAWRIPTAVADAFVTSLGMANAATRSACATPVRPLALGMCWLLIMSVRQRALQSARPLLLTVAGTRPLT
jgi:hypothetical protein